MGLLQDGFGLLIDLTGAGTTFEEISGSIPGHEGGDRIDLTTNRNTNVMTYAAQRLRDMTEMSMNVAYESSLTASIKSQINVNQLITLTLPDGSTFAFWGYLKTFQPGEMTKGGRPTAQIVISPTNLDDSDPPVETDAVHTPAP